HHDAFVTQEPHNVGQIRSKVTVDVSKKGQFREEEPPLLSRECSFRPRTDHSRSIEGHSGSKVNAFRSNGYAFPAIAALFRDVADARLPRTEARPSRRRGRTS